MIGGVPALRIDFQRRQQAYGPLLGIVLFATGVLAAGAAFVEHDAVERDIESAQRRLAQFGKSADRAANTPVTENKELLAGLKAMDAVTAQLAVPWGTLLTALESAAGDDIALLTLNAEPAARSVRASGEARDLKAVTGYVRRLEATNAVVDVRLGGHETRPQSPGRPVAFTLTARWEPAP